MLNDREYMGHKAPPLGNTRTTRVNRPIRIWELIWRLPLAVLAVGLSLLSLMLFISFFFIVGIFAAGDPDGGFGIFYEPFYIGIFFFIFIAKKALGY